MDKQVKIATEIIKKEVEGTGLKTINILLFGSRARGDYKEGSDWDFYVIVDKDIGFSEKKRDCT